MIKSPKNKRIWIKGISLHSYFQHGELFDALYAAVIRGVEVKVLLIDPDGDQAKTRSFREFQIDRPGASWESFNDDERKKQRLYRDTGESIQHIKMLMQEIDAIKAGAKFEARLFSSAPEAFIMLTDNSVLIEQYHYGKIRPLNSESMMLGRILAGDVPLAEYVQQTPERNPLKDPYRIFEDHFRFVFGMSLPIERAAS